MRVISQDGSFDFPYEQIVIQRFMGRIYVLNANLTGVEEVANDYVIARYSTEEKAIKAMEMLHDACIYLKQCEIKNDYIQMPPACFQFPADDEIEV